MRKLALLLSIIALPLAFTATAAANTTQTQLVTIHDTFAFGDATDACGFPVDLRIDGTFKVIDYFDNSGTLFKEIINNFGGPFTLSAINPANGKSTTTQSQTVVAVNTFNPDGSLASSRTSGLTYNFVVPGLGTILQMTGRLIVENDELVFEAGQQDFIDGNTAAFCGYMADP